MLSTCARLFAPIQIQWTCCPHTLASLESPFITIISSQRSTASPWRLLPILRLAYGLVSSKNLHYDFLKIRVNFSQLGSLSFNFQPIFLFSSQEVWLHTCFSRFAKAEPVVSIFEFWVCLNNQNQETLQLPPSYPCTPFSCTHKQSHTHVHSHTLSLSQRQSERERQRGR